MNAKEARAVLAIHRAGRPQDARLQKALDFLAQDPALKLEYERQTELDDRVANLLQALPLPEGLLDRMLQLEPGKRRLDWRATLRQPPALAALLGLVVIFGVLLFFWMDKRDNFPGRDSLFHMLSTAEGISGADFEPLITESAKVGDWFMLKYGLEDFDVPPEFGAMKTVECRLFKEDAAPVAQIVVRRDGGAADTSDAGRAAAQGGGLLFFIFRADDLGVKLPSSDRWYIFTQEEWTAAVHGENKTCFMVALRGTRSEMNDFLASLPKEPVQK